MINIFYNKDFIKIRLCLGLSSKSHRKQMSRQQDCSVLFVTLKQQKGFRKMCSLIEIIEKLVVVTDDIYRLVTCSCFLISAMPILGHPCLLIMNHRRQRLKPAEDSDTTVCKVVNISIVLPYQELHHVIIKLASNLSSASPSQYLNHQLQRFPYLLCQ